MLDKEAAQDCRTEIIELHRFFVDWFAGALPNDDATWSVFANLMAPSFTLISPSGEAQDREALLANLRVLHGSRPPEQGFAIWIENYTCRLVDDRLILTTYEEWQRIDGKEKGRLSTALFERFPSGPNRVRWLHVQETWLPEG